MFNIIKELKTVEKSNNTLTNAEILEAFKQGVVFSDIHVSKKDYQKAIDTWGFDVKATNQTFFESLDYVKNTDELDLQLAQFVYYCMFEYALFEEQTLITFTNEKDVDTFIDTLVTISVVDDIRPVLSKHIQSVKTLSYDREDYVKLAKSYNLDIDVRKMASRDLKSTFMLEFNIPYRTVAEIVASIDMPTRAGKRFNIHQFQFELKQVNLIVNSLLAMDKEQIIKESATYRKELMLFKKLDKDKLRTKINSCLRLGKKQHEVKKQSFLEQAVNNTISAEKFLENLNTLTNLQVFRLYLGIESAMTGTTRFLVKTGRIARNENRQKNVSKLLEVKKQLLQLELIKRFKNENVRVILPKNIELALPSSYKNFIGNIPFFSQVDINEEGSIGIIWHSSCDYDLSALTECNNAVGYWTNKKITNLYYSGDVRSAGPRGAAEYVSYERGVDDFSIFVNLYSSYNDGVDIAKVFVTDNLSFEVTETPRFMLPVENFQGQIGTKAGNKVILGGVQSFSADSSRDLNNADELAIFMKERADHVLTLNELVELVGWQVVEQDYVPKNEEEIIYDFSLDKLSKQTFIEIFGE